MSLYFLSGRHLKQPKESIAIEAPKIKKAHPIFRTGFLFTAHFPSPLL
jgi:hypothetical protein